MSRALLIAGYYFAYFGALGVFLPFFTLWLTAHGVARAEATRVLSLVPLTSLLAPPLAGLVADARRARGWLLRLASLGAFVAFLGYFGARSRAAIWATTALFALMRAPVIALVDATTLDHVRHHGGSYGRIRLWGSLGFLVAALAAGPLVERTGAGAVVVAGAWGLGATAALAFALPTPPPVADRGAFVAWRAFVADARSWLFLGAAALGYGATAAYDSGFTLYLVSLGYGGRFIGAAWATGVAAEIVLMAASRRLVDAVGAERLFAWTLVAGAVRWALLSRVTSPTAILCLQPLHGVTFGLFWVSGVTLARRHGGGAPTAAQGLFSAAIGVGSLIGMNVTGRLLDAGGGPLLYLVAAGCATVGAVAAWSYARIEPAPCS